MLSFTVLPDFLTSFFSFSSFYGFLDGMLYLPARRRPQGLVVIGVCLSVCLSVRIFFVRKISQERVHGSPPNLVGGSRG